MADSLAPMPELARSEIAGTHHAASGFSQPEHGHRLVSKALANSPYADAPAVFRGRGEDLLGLMLANSLLTVVSGGIYLPWARVRHRQFMTNNSTFAGRPLLHHGRGEDEYFRHVRRGYALLAVAGVALLAFHLGGVGPAAIVVGLTLAGVALAWPWLQYRSWQRTCTHLTWGRWPIELLDEGLRSYTRSWLWGACASVLTLGAWHPVWHLRCARAVVSQCKIGSEQLQFTFDPKAATRFGLRAWILHVLSLGLYNPWYRAELYRRSVSSIYCGKIGLACELRGGQLLGYDAALIVGSCLSLGIALPWLLCWRRRQLLASLSIQQHSPADDTAAEL